MNVSRTLRVLFAVSVAPLLWGCHLDGLWFHECTAGLNYSNGWDLAELSFEHAQPEICPISLTQGGTDNLWVSFEIVDDLPRNFWDTKFWIFNSSGVVRNGPQFDYFHTHFDDWAVDVYASYTVGTGSNPCYDRIRFEMADYYPGVSTPPLPWADGNLTYTYSVYPTCTSDNLIARPG